MNMPAKYRRLILTILLLLLTNKLVWCRVFVLRLNGLSVRLLTAVARLLASGVS